MLPGSSDEQEKVSNCFLPHSRFPSKRPADGSEIGCHRWLISGGPRQVVLLIDFVKSDDDTDQRKFQKFIETNIHVQSQFRLFVLARLPIDYEIDQGNTPLRLIDDAVFKYLLGQQGISIIDLKHEGKPYFGDVATSFPFASGKYYS